MDNSERFVANIRFGFGGPPISARPAKTWLSEQLTATGFRDKAFQDLDSSTSLIQEYIRDRAKTEAAKEERKQRIRAVYLGELAARVRHHRTTDYPFRERLVRFWSNHFTVSITKPELRALVGSFEREAIRPHVTGSFQELLESATQHPAMLLYLDNARSIGPRSPAAQGSRRGLNENHARELLELHTLGVEGGYGQADVEALARLLTGWGVSENGYLFDSRKHEPGEVEFLGYAYPDLGERSGKAALQDLSRHPSTAAFVAEKLCRHFLSDDPEPSAIERIKTVFLDTEGDLLSVSLALLDEPTAWEPFHKFKTPYELIISALRSLPSAEEEDPKNIRFLGQSPFTAPSPAGWSDRQSDWLTPEAIGARIDWAQSFGVRFQRGLKVDKIAISIFGPLLSEKTLDALRVSSFPLALLLASPEFQWR